MSEKMFCNNCGFELPDPRAKFCPACGQQIIVATPIAGMGPSFSQSSQPMPVPAAGPWDPTRLVGMGKIHAVMIVGAQQERGDLELVTSGVQFSSGSLLQIPFSDIRGASMVRGMGTFAIETRSGQTFTFKVYGAPGYVRMINKLIGNPNLAKTGGIEGTPAQIRGKGAAMIGIGATAATLGALFLPWYIMLVGILLIVSGVRYLAAAKRAELSAGK